jgi:hypothetical protein
MVPVEIGERQSVRSFASRNYFLVEVRARVRQFCFYQGVFRAKNIFIRG